jgi:glutamate dehydrogenase
MRKSRQAEAGPLGKEQLARLEELVLGTGFLSEEKARELIRWFLYELGIDAYYFRFTTVEEIARHLIAIGASRLAAQAGGEGVGIELMNEREDRAVYIVEEDPDRTEEIERRIESRYPLSRLESYITKEGGRPFVRLYVVTKPEYGPPLAAGETPEFERAADCLFLERSEAETVGRYRELWQLMNEKEVPVIAVSDKTETGETRVMIGIHSSRAQNFLNLFSHLFNQYRIYSNRKYREVFSDEKKIYSFYFDRLEPRTIEDFSRDLLGLIMLPHHPLASLFLSETFLPQETLYAVAAAAYAHQFLTMLTEEYATVSEALRDQPEVRGIVDRWKLRLTKDTFSEDRIADTVTAHAEIVRTLYGHFCARLDPGSGGAGATPSGSGAGLGAAEEKVGTPGPSGMLEALEPLEKRIGEALEREVAGERERTILRTFLAFNRAVSRTNFFIRDKRCLAVRLDPRVVGGGEYPDRPFGVFFFVGREFVGFHIRFRDIARGGIRIVKSGSHAEYEHNLDTIFLENYNLAHTQQRKNKDIPEGGAKGTLLLRLQNQEEVREAFISYIDAMLDLLIPRPDVLDLAGARDILFLGPDERTAELMDWAALYARRRKYPYWKAFTTGKSLSLGGIPHDLYGMTTAGVHEYVLAVLEKLGLQEEQLTKVQTGGPDGDLGSNEILVSRDRTIAVIDGSGVLYDPQGLDREELVRLARNRTTVASFDRKRLSAGGFFVSVQDRDVRLPDGTRIPNGEVFRNLFHLSPLARADLFVPCGGRPGAVNITNWRQLLDERGAPKFRIIVEGANLFITEDARLRLEEKGVVLVKDASANKGGVTSSSLEVYASLALSDEQYRSHMVVGPDGKVPPFRGRYVEEILSRVRANARSEFELLWREHQARRIPLATLSNRISERINAAADAIAASELVRGDWLRQRVLSQYTPACLLELVGIDGILERVPESYLDAVVATTLATRFIYGQGLDANEVDFYAFIASLERQA